MFLTRLTVITLMTALVCVTGSESLAQPPCDNYSSPPGRVRGEEPVLQDRLVERLDLTPEQEQELNSIRDKYSQEIETNRGQLREGHQKLREMMASDSSVADLRQQHQQVMSLGDNLANLRFESMLEIREILTPEQRQELANLAAQRRSRGRKY